MFILKGCPDCGGDLTWDDEDKEWVCFFGHRHSQKKMEHLKRLREAEQRQKAMINPADLLPIPPKPDVGRGGGTKNLIHQYYEANKEQIIADSKLLTCREFLERWGMGSGTWAFIRRRWGLPLRRYRRRLPVWGIAD
jgi:hypothetical protein